jgi:PAS domain S-box-containing protein
MVRERTPAPSPEGDSTRAVLEATIAAAPPLLRVEGCAVLLASAERTALRAVAWRNLSEPQVQALADMLTQPQAAALLASGRPLLPRVGDGLPSETRAALQAEGWPDLIAVPLPGTGRPVGVLAAVPDGDGRWSPARIDAAMRLGALVAAALRAAVRATEGERRRRQAASLLERLPLLRGGGPDADASLATVVTALGDALNLSHCLGLLLPPIESFAEFCQPAATPIGPPVAPQQHPMWRVLEQGGAWTYDDADASAADRSATARMLGGVHVRSLLALPVRRQGSLTGTLVLVQAERRRTLSDDERSFAEAVTAELAAALQEESAPAPVAPQADLDIAALLTAQAALAAARSPDEMVTIAADAVRSTGVHAVVLVAWDAVLRRLRVVAARVSGQVLADFPDAPLGDDLVSEAVRDAVAVRGPGARALPRPWRRVYRPRRDDVALAVPARMPSGGWVVVVAIGPDPAALARATPLLQSLTMQMGIGLACLDQIARAQQRDRRLTALNEVLRATAAATDVAAACREASAALARTVPDTDFVNIWLLDEAGATLERVSISGVGQALDGMAERIDLGLDAGATRAVHDGQTHIWQADDPRTPEFTRALMERATLRTLVTVPMRTVERITGVLSLGSSALRSYDREDLTFLETLAGQLGGQLALVRARERVENERGRLASLLATLPEGIIVIDAAGTVVLHNAAAEEIAQIPLGGRPLADLVQTVHVLSMDGRPLAWEDLPLVHALRGERAIAVELIIQRPGGAEIPLLASAGPVRDGQGAIVGSVAVFQDLTSLHELSTMKDDFVNTVSHELRTPVTTIRGGALTLLKRRHSLDDQTQTDLLTDIADEAERLHLLVEDLLALSRSRRGIAVSSEPVLLHRLVNRVILELGGRVGSHALLVSVPTDLPPVEADPDLTRQVLRNLLENAVKFSPRGGQVEVSAELSDGRVVVSVLDRGSGIPSEDMDRVFEPFYRSDESVRAGTQGAGLGLAVCRRLVEMQGGRIWAESREGGGAAFRFTLPIAVGDE